MANTNYRTSIPTISEFFTVLGLDWDDLTYDFCDLDSDKFEHGLSAEEMQTKIDNVDLLTGKADSLIKWFKDDADTVLRLLIEYKGNSKSTLDELLDCDWGDEFGECYQYGYGEDWEDFLGNYIEEGLLGEEIQALQKINDRYINYENIEIDWTANGWRNEGNLFYFGS